MNADRNLYVTADRSEVVEESDPRCAYLLYPAGRAISPGDVARYGLTERAGKVALKAVSRPQMKVVEAHEDKASREPEPVEDDVNEDAESEEWTMAVSPEVYLKRYPDGPHAELARRIFEVESEPASGEP